MKYKRHSNSFYPQDSPVDEERKKLPRGDAKWPGFDKVYTNLQAAARKMSLARHVHLSEDHIWIMAVSGTGHEATMKGAQIWLRTYGWI